jgi:hypothetical protein
MLLEIGSIGIETGKFLIGEAPVNIAEGDDVLTGKIDEVAATHPANADASNVHRVARRYKTATKNIAREDSKSSTGNSSLGDKVASRNFVLFS